VRKAKLDRILRDPEGRFGLPGFRRDGIPDIIGLCINPKASRPCPLFLFNHTLGLLDHASATPLSGDSAGDHPGAGRKYRVTCRNRLTYVLWFIAVKAPQFFMNLAAG